MAKPRFELKRPNGDEETLINCIFFFNNVGRLKVSTRKKIHPKYWNTREGRARVFRDYPHAKRLNYYLDSIENRLKDVLLDEEKKGGTPSIDRIKKELKSFIGTGPKNDRVNLFEFWQRRIEENTGHYRPYTIKNHKSARNNLMTFAKDCKVNLDFDTLSLDMYRKILRYFWDVRGLTDGGVGSIVKSLKAIMSDAVKTQADDPLNEYGLEGVQINQAFKHPHFKVLNSTSHVKIALSEAQLQQLKDLELKEGSKLDKVRDVFLINCWIGLRYSDMKKLNKRHFYQAENGNTFIKIRLTKSGEKQEVQIPILVPYVLKILEKWDFRPPCPSEQKMNDYVKELGQLAGFDKVHIQTRHFGPKKEVLERPEYELLGTHTARRTFCTNLYRRGLPSLSIMAISGHKKEQSFLKYINVSQAELAQNLIEMFNNSNQMRAVK